MRPKIPLPFRWCGFPNGSTILTSRPTFLVISWVTTRSVSFLRITPSCYCMSMESKLEWFFFLNLKCLKLTHLFFFSRAIQYVERDGIEKYHTLDCYPPELEKRMKILTSVQALLMQENFIKSGGSVLPRKGDELFRIPFLRQWFRTSRAVVMHLTNGTLQVKHFRWIKFYFSSTYRFLLLFYRSIISEITSK
jgi:hypothetical protein